MITNLIEPCMGKMILNHLTGNNCPEFLNGLLRSYFYKLTLESGCLEFYGDSPFQKLPQKQCFRGIHRKRCSEKMQQMYSRTLMFQKISVVFKPELSTQLGTYTVFKFNQ